MSQGQRSSPQQPSSSKGGFSVTGENSPDSKPDDWSDVKDPVERRKIQNKLAQRRFRKQLDSGMRMVC
jgi:hypothetical protein